MANATWDVVIDGLQRLESPCLDLDGNVCVSDIAGDGSVYRLRSDGALEMIVHRKNVGGLVPHADGGLVATGSTVVVIDETGERTVMEPEGGWGFNDFATDGSGNLFVGMHAEPPKATPPTVEASPGGSEPTWSSSTATAGSSSPTVWGCLPTAGGFTTTTHCPDSCG